MNIRNSNDRVVARRALDVAINAGNTVEADGLIASIKSFDDSQARAAQATVSVAVVEEGRSTGVGKAFTSANFTYSERSAKTADERTGEYTSFMADAMAARQGDPLAAERIASHQREMSNAGLISARSTNTGSYVGLVVPQYLTREAALVARAAGPVASAINAKGGRELPTQGMSLIIPRETTGSAVASQATENSAVQLTDSVWSNVTAPVVTIAGQAVVSRQAIDRGIPGLDALIYADLAGAWISELDRQILVGTGTGNTALGMTATGSIYQASAFSAAATTTTFWSKLAGAVNSIEAAGNNVGPADLIICHPRRFNWLMSQVDGQGRPLVTPVNNGGGLVNGLGVMSAPGTYSGISDAGIGTGPAVESFQIKGYLFGLPVVTDANIPTNLGTGSLEDVVAVVSTRHHLLFTEGKELAPRVLSFEQTAGASLSTTIVAYGYAAYTAGRAPLATALVGGNAGTSGFGLTTPVF